MYVAISPRQLRDLAERHGGKLVHGAGGVVRRLSRLIDARAGELATLFRSANVHEPGALRHAVWGHFLRGYCRETQEWEPKQRKALTRAVLAQIG